MDLWAINHNNRWTVYFISARAAAWAAENPAFAGAEEGDHVHLSEYDYAQFCDEAARDGMILLEDDEKVN
jgi:hypothetical protein